MILLKILFQIQQRLLIKKQFYALIYILIKVSQHRGSSKIEARDARYILATKFKMAIPSESFLGGTILSNNSMFGGTTGLPPPAKRPALTAHQQRMALIDKTLKKL